MTDWASNSYSLSVVATDCSSFSDIPYSVMINVFSFVIYIMNSIYLAQLKNCKKDQISVRKA